MIVLAVYGCGGFSTDQAKERCNAEQQGRGNCFDGKSFDSCTTCFEDCGDDCIATVACPVRYVCSNDESPTGQVAE